jgi:hypothetical protein
VLGPADPAEPVAGVLDDGVADLLEERGLVAGADERLVAAAERPLGAIQPPHRLLRGLSLGDVLHGTDALGRGPGRAELHLSALAHPLHPVVDEDAVLHVVRGPAERGLPRAIERLAVVRMDVREEGVIGQRCSRCDAEDPEHLGRPGELVAQHVEVPAADVGDGLRAVERRLACAQRPQRLRRGGGGASEGQADDNPRAQVDRRGEERCVTPVAGSGGYEQGHDERRPEDAGGQPGGRAAQPHGEEHGRVEERPRERPEDGPERPLQSKEHERQREPEEHARGQGNIESRRVPRERPLARETAWHRAAALSPAEGNGREAVL